MDVKIICSIKDIFGKPIMVIQRNIELSLLDFIENFATLVEDARKTGQNLVLSDDRGDYEASYVLTPELLTHCYFSIERYEEIEI